MKNNHFTDHALGAKTIWIIDFSNHEQITGKKPLFSLYAPSRSWEKNPKDNTLEQLKGNYTHFLEAITKLCNLIEKDCRENIKELSVTKEEIQSVDNSITALGNIIKKFNEMLQKLRKKPPPESSQ